MLKSDFNVTFMTLSVGSAVTWDPQDFSPEVCRQGEGSWQAGRGENHQRSLPAAPGWVSAEKGLSPPVPLSLISVLPQALDAVSSFKPTPSKLTSATFYIANHRRPVSCQLQL